MGRTARVGQRPSCYEVSLAVRGQDLNENFHTVRLFNTVSVYGLMFGPIKQNNFITLENDIMQINVGSITYI